jgi:UPF0755 protein
MRRVFYETAILAAIIAVAAIVVGWQAVRFLDAPVAVPEQGMVYEILAGTSFAAVSNDLGGRGVITHPVMFRWFARFRGDANRIHAGEYRIEAGTTPAQLLQKFVSGDVRLYSFTIVEGWTYRDLIGALHDQEAIVPSLDDDGPAILETLRTEAIHPEVTHPEGLFLPETYRFPKGTRDVEILQRAYDMMARTLAAEWSQRVADLPFADPYEALILASIIERETAREDERGKIAGVFVRRLQKGMRLQTDPAVIYGIGPDFDGNLTRRHLQMSTPYNTYTRSGLPPTPIAMPGKAAIHAALNPTPGLELYFVATGFPDGSHRFSTTREEHEAAVAEYLARLRKSRTLPANANDPR